MSDVLRGRRVAILATDGVERVLEQPREAVEEAGAGSSCCRSTTARSPPATTTWRTRAPYGRPTRLRRLRRRLRRAAAAGRHGDPDKLRWTSTPSTSCASSSTRASRSPPSATGRGRCSRPASFPAAHHVVPDLCTDLRNAGAKVVDAGGGGRPGARPSRSPDDLPAFCDQIVEEFAEGRHADRLERASS